MRRFLRSCAHTSIARSFRCDRQVSKQTVDRWLRRRCRRPAVAVLARRRCRGVWRFSSLLRRLLCVSRQGDVWPTHSHHCLRRRVELCGLCGSDLHPYNCREPQEQGCIMGHEFVGSVAAVGGAVRKFKPGDRVMSPFTSCCGACFYCRRGLTARWAVSRSAQAASMPARHPRVPSSCSAGPEAVLSGEHRCERSQLFGWREGGCGLHGAQAQYIRQGGGPGRSMAALPLPTPPCMPLDRQRDGSCKPCPPRAPCRLRRVPLADSTLAAVPLGVSDEEALLLGDILSTGWFCAESGGIAQLAAEGCAGGAGGAGGEVPGPVVAVVGCGPVAQLAILSERAGGVGVCGERGGLPHLLACLSAALASSPPPPAVPTPFPPRCQARASWGLAPSLPSTRWPTGWPWRSGTERCPSTANSRTPWRRSGGHGLGAEGGGGRLVTHHPAAERAGAPYSTV
jgi:hypothetical protein